jgi:hypothetical protein
MTQPERFRLANVDAGGIGREHAANLIQQVALALGFEQIFQLRIGIEVVLDGALGGTRDEHEAARTGPERLLHGVLDERLVDDRQHLLGTCLGGGEKAGAPPCHGKHCRTDRRLQAHRGPPDAGARECKTARVAGGTQFAVPHRPRSRNATEKVGGFAPNRANPPMNAG